MARSVLIVGTDTGWNLESSYARAFRQLGWTVNFWNPMEALHRVARGNRLGRLFSTFVHVEPWLRKANLKLLQCVDDLRPQLMLVIGTYGVWAGTLAQIKVVVPELLIYCIYPDTPHNLGSDRVLCLPFFDRVAVVSPAWVEAFERLGAPRVNFLPLAADPELHYPATKVEGKHSLAHDVVFVGNWRADREVFLERLVDFDLFLWGSPYWKQKTRPGSPLRARWGGRPITGTEFAQVCVQSRILLNVIDAVGWPGPNMRMFEQSACRAFTLVNRTPAVINLFREGETIECFDTVEEARDKIDYYLANESERQRIAEASYRFVVQGGHTYTDRTQQLISWMDTDTVK
jgi:glycosyltransferase involved in cell wall biosynthesis